MKFKEYFVDDITYGMLVIGASMEETFDHILFCGDWELAVARARKDEGCLEIRSHLLMMMTASG